MCLIAIAPSGVDKYGEIFLEGLITSAKTNTDGIGIGIRNRNKTELIITKGSNDISTFIDQYRKLKLNKDTEVIVHLRKVSAGVKNAVNCHPFLCSQDDNMIDVLGPISTKVPAVFHNGHLFDFAKDASPHSDTYMFVKKFMRYNDIMHLLKTDVKAFKQLFGNVIGNSKFAIQFHNRDFITLGDFITDSGYLFSNGTYKSSKVADVGGSAVPVKQTKLDIPALQDRPITSTTALERTNIKINSENYNKVVLICKKADEDIGIEVGERFLIHKYKNVSGSVVFHMLQQLNKPALYAWVDDEDVEKCFDVYSKKSNVDLFKEYQKLKNAISPVHKSTIQKLNKRLGVHTRRGKSGRDKIDIKYAERKIETYYASLVMFIKDYENFLNVPVNTNEEVETPPKTFSELPKQDVPPRENQPIQVGG